MFLFETGMSSTEDRNRCIEALEQGALYRTYRGAFEAATGMPLYLVSAENSEIEIKNESAEGNDFCDLVRSNEQTCQHCVEVTRRLQREARHHTASTVCFAGLTETFVPIRVGRETIGFLRTGEVFNSTLHIADRRRVKDALLGLIGDESLVDEFSAALSSISVVETARYEGTVKLLEAFSLQLSQQALDLTASQRDEEPESVQRAKRYIQRNLSDPITLSDVASYSGMSVSAFCRVFKDSMGMTCVQWVNRKRIEWARQELLRRDTRVSEIAYKVGFSSLSQFNRVFSSVLGKAPTAYRKERLELVSRKV